MTNEEKAEQLMWCVLKEHTWDDKRQIKECALLMAEWKEQQMIEKACDAYCKVCGHYPHTVPASICRQDCDYYSDFVKHLKTSSRE